MSDFEAWLKDKAHAESMTIPELAKQAGLGPSTLINIFKGRFKAGPDVCNAIAEVLDTNPVIVYRKAGILPPKPHGDESVAGEDEVVEYFRQMDEESREIALTILRALRDKDRSKK